MVLLVTGMHPGNSLARRLLGAMQGLGLAAEQTDCGPDLPGLLRRERPDFVFPALSGSNAEDGTLQSMLESLGIPYTGPDLDSCLHCWDKHACKQRLRAEGVGTPRWEALDNSTLGSPAFATRLSALAMEIGLPLLVKPACGASSSGVAVVRRSEDMQPAVAKALDQDDRAIVERFVPGRQLVATVLGPPSEPRVLPHIEVCTDKPGASARDGIAAATLAVADLGLDDADRVATVARRAYTAAGCRDLAQIEVVLDVAAGPQVLEVAPSPDLSGRGPARLAAAAAGMSFDDLVEAVVTRVRA